jgi:hypothetical protein
MTAEEAAAWVERLRRIGQQAESHSQDPRTLVEILNDDRR